MSESIFTSKDYPNYPTRAFDASECQDLYLKDSDDALSYFKKYFFKMTDGSVYMFKPNSDGKFTFTNIQKETLSKNYSSIKRTVVNGKKAYIVSIVDDFYSPNVPIYEFECDRYQPLFNYVIEENGQYTLNITQRFNKMFYTDLTFNDFDDDVKNKAKEVLKCFSETICSKDEKQTDFLFFWVSNIINPRSNIDATDNSLFVNSKRGNQSAIVMKSAQGCGKSTFTEFLQLLVGDDAWYATDNSTDITKFNGCLENKIILNLTELASYSSTEWSNFSGVLKNIITNGTRRSEKKGKDQKIVVNNLNIIVDSNRDCIKLDKDDRRWFIPDISIEHMQDEAYFIHLKSLYHDKNVLTCLFKYFESYESKFGFVPGCRPPMSENKLDKINDILPMGIKYLKYKYLYSKKPFQVDMKFKDFVEKINNDSYQVLRESCQFKFSSLKKEYIELSKDMFYVGSGRDKGTCFIKFDFQFLFDMLKKKNWISAEDKEKIVIGQEDEPEEFDEQDIEEMTIGQLKEALTQKLSENLRLKKEIAELKNKLHN